MTKSAQYFLASFLSCIFTLSIAAENENADPLKQKLLAEYQKASDQTEWTNHLMLGTSMNLESGPSGDEMLAQIVAQYTRENLDRGGWVNAYLSNSNYSVGNLLLFAEIGEGITVTAGS